MDRALDRNQNQNLAADKPSRAFCNECRESLDAFGETVQELLLLHEQLFQSIVAGDPESDRFDLLIHMANEKKYRAKYAYLRHMETHGSQSDATEQS